VLSRDSTRASGGLLLMTLFVFSVGCGPNYKARGSVKGKVTFEGKSLPTGTVVFLGKNNMSGSAAIDKDGNYSLPDAPLGDVTIIVMVPKPPPGGLEKMKLPPGTKEGKSIDPEGSGKSISIMGTLPTHIVPIPDKYGNEATSGLTYTVQKGEQTHNIALTP
jgi:hypothetical protein